MDMVVALQDAVVLARTLRDVMGQQSSLPEAVASNMTSTAVEAALREYEVERSNRVLKISVRSNLMGTVLQIPYAPVRGFFLLSYNSGTCMRWAPTSAAKCEDLS